MTSLYNAVFCSFRTSEIRILRARDFRLCPNSFFGIRSTTVHTHLYTLWNFYDVIVSLVRVFQTSAHQKYYGTLQTPAGLQSLLDTYDMAFEEPILREIFIAQLSRVLLAVYRWELSTFLSWPHFMWRLVMIRVREERPVEHYKHLHGSSVSWKHTMCRSRGQHYEKFSSLSCHVATIHVTFEAMTCWIAFFLADTFNVSFDAASGR